MYATIRQRVVKPTSRSTYKLRRSDGTWLTTYSGRPFETSYWLAANRVVKESDEALTIVTIN